MKSTQEEIDKVVELRDGGDKTWEEIAAICDFSVSTAKRRYRAGTLEQVAAALNNDVALDELPEQAPLKIKAKTYLPDGEPIIERFKPLVRTGDAIIICDLHIPLHDPEFLNVMIDYARSWEQKKLIIGGDFFTMEAFSSFVPHQPEATWENERYQGNLVMKTLLKTFDEIDFIWGNHDFRLAKAVGFKHSFTECMKWALDSLTDKEKEKIRFSDLDYMYYYPGSVIGETGEGKKYRVCHPRNFSSIPLTVPRKLSLKYDCGIITAHSHHCAIGSAINGRDLVIEAGGFFDKSRTEYIQKTTTHHEWTQGFVSFIDGIPTLISPVIGNDREYR